MKRDDVIAWLGESRFGALPEPTREVALEQVLNGPTAAPNVPTAGIWILQKCGLKPTEADLTRWSKDVSGQRPKRSR